MESENQIENEKTINENGEIEVQVSTVGEVVGSDQDGNPVSQNITEGSLAKIASDLNSSNKEVLVDADHQSAREGLDRDTRAMGWLSRFWANAKGLFAWLKLTPTGQQMVEGREYRKLSPVFTLDEQGTPMTLESAAFTNTPAMEAIDPILNQKPGKEDGTAEKSDDGTAGEGRNDSVQTPDTDEVKETEVSKADNPDISTETEKKEVSRTDDARRIEELEKRVNELTKALDECTAKATEMESENERLKQAVDACKKPQKRTVNETIKEDSLNMMPTKASLSDEKPWGELKGDALLTWARSHL